MSYSFGNFAGRSPPGSFCLPCLHFSCPQHRRRRSCFILAAARLNVPSAEPVTFTTAPKFVLPILCIRHHSTPFHAETNSGRQTLFRDSRASVPLPPPRQDQYAGTTTPVCSFLLFRLYGRTRLLTGRDVQRLFSRNHHSFDKPSGGEKSTSMIPSCCRHSRNTARQNSGRQIIIPRQFSIWHSVFTAVRVDDSGRDCCPVGSFPPRCHSSPAASSVDDSGQVIIRCGSPDALPRYRYLWEHCRGTPRHCRIRRRAGEMFPHRNLGCFPAHLGENPVSGGEHPRISRDSSGQM